MRKYLLFIPFLLLVLAMTVHPVASQTPSDYPTRISLSGSFAGGLLGWDGSMDAKLRNQGWSTYAISRSGPIANLFYAMQIDFDAEFGDIDFSMIEDWEIRENNSIFITDTPSYDFTLDIEMGNISVQIDYFGQLGTKYCNYEDACNLIDSVFALLRGMEREAPIAVPQVTSALTIMFVILAIALPSYFSKRSSQHPSKSWISLLEMIALFIDYNILFGLCMLVLPSNFLEPYIAFIVALIAEMIIFWVYFKLVWLDKTSMSDESSSEGEVEF